MLHRPVLPLLALVAAEPAAAAPSTPSSAGWRLVVEDEEPDVGRVVGFADSGTLSRSGSELGFWLEYRLERPAEGADGYRGYVTADCADFTYSSVALARLAGRRVIEQGGEESGLTAAPGSNLRSALENLCAGRFLGPKVDPAEAARKRFGR